MVNEQRPYKLIWICHGLLGSSNPYKQSYNFNFNCLNFYCPNGNILYSDPVNMTPIPEVICEDNYNLRLSKFPRNNGLYLREMTLGASDNDRNIQLFNNAFGIYLCNQNTNNISKLYDINDLIAETEANGNGINIQEVFRKSENFVIQYLLNPEDVDMCLFCCRSTIEVTANFTNIVNADRTTQRRITTMHNPPEPESMDIGGGGNKYLLQVSENEFYKYIDKEKNVKFLSKNNIMPLQNLNSNIIIARGSKIISKRRMQRKKNAQKVKFTKRRTHKK